MKNRLQLPDTIRGIVLVSMIIYHASWNLVYIYNVKWEWYHSRGAYLWQQSICWTFILLSGFCFSLGRRHLKNGLVVFGSGALVTAVTLLFMPQNRVVFGVLTCIGSCILILTITGKLWKKVKAEGGLIVSFLLFLLTKNINSGYLGIAGIKAVEIPIEWFSNYLTAYLGFPPRGFYSTDYFSLFPWLFLFMTGFYLYQIFRKRDILKKKFMEKGIPVFSFWGKHSLLIYLLHQPVIYGLQEMIFK